MELLVSKLFGTYLDINEVYACVVDMYMSVAGESRSRVRGRCGPGGRVPHVVGCTVRNPY